MEENKFDTEDKMKEIEPVPKHEEAENAAESIPEELEKVVESAPEEMRHELKQMVGMYMQMGGRISPQAELMKKMQPEHVTEYLAGQREASQNQFKESRERKIFLAFVLMIILIFVVVLVVILKDESDLLEKVLYTLGGLITGLIGGYGYGKSRDD